MFRRWTVAYFTGGFMPLFDAADAQGAGGGADPVDGGAGDPPADGDIDDPAPAAGDPSVSDADDDDDDDDLELDPAQPITEERFKKVAARLKKLNRRDRKNAALRQRIAELHEQGLTLDDLVTSHRNYNALDRTIRGNPRLARAIYGDGEDDSRSAPARRQAEPAEDAFDEARFPFERDSDGGKYLMTMARTLHDQGRLIRQLQSQLTQVDGRHTATVEATERREWKGAIEAAAGHIQDDGVRTLFKDALAAAFRERGNHRMSPQAAVNHYLKMLKVNPQQAAAASAAAGKKPGAPAQVARTATQQRIAEQNRSLPRTVAPTGNPAPARQQRERVADVNKRLRQLSTA